MVVVCGGGVWGGSQPKPKSQAKPSRPTFMRAREKGCWIEEMISPIELNAEGLTRAKGRTFSAEKYAVVPSSAYSIRCSCRLNTVIDAPGWGTVRVVGVVVVRVGWLGGWVVGWQTVWWWCIQVEDDGGGGGGGWHGVVPMKRSDFCTPGQ